MKKIHWYIPITLSGLVVLSWIGFRESTYMGFWIVFTSVCMYANGWLDKDAWDKRKQ